MRRKHRVAVAVRLLAAVVLVGLMWYWWRGKSSARHSANRVQAPSRGSTAIQRPSTLATNGESLASPQAETPKPRESASSPISKVRNPRDQELAVDKNARAPTVVTPPPTELSPTNYPRAVQNVLELQVALASRGISSGSLDGLIGPQTRAALRSFQQKENLPITGELDKSTREHLLLETPPLTSYALTSNDLAVLQPLSSTWLGKSQQSALEYETLLEMASEKGQANPSLIRRLNPDLDWTNLGVGVTIKLPNVSYPPRDTHAAYVTIRLGDKVLEAWDEHTNLLAHFPCSIARRVDKRPVGELHVAVIAPHPNYTFDPEIFPESAEARELKTKLVLPPGPNNPVGVAWIGLDKPGYGIHGTPNPEQVGRTESHGCFRLANWNAEYLLRLVALGIPVYVQP